MDRFNIRRLEGYTIMSNHHLRDMNLSHSARGLLSFMLSLPENWDYSFNGLVVLSKEGKAAVRSMINELKAADYVKISRFRNKKGYFQYTYDVSEIPFKLLEKSQINPQPDFRTTDYRTSDNQSQINTNKQNTNKQIDEIDKIDKSEPPNAETESISITHNILTLELIQANYVNEDSPETFYYDDLFKSFLEKGKSYKQLYSVLHYIVDKIQARNYIDENGDEIENRFGYFKSSLESNFRQFENMPDELYPDDKDIISDNWLEWR